MTISTKSVPKGMHTLNPHIVCADCAQALEFYTSNSPQPIGKIRSEIRRYFVTPGQATSYKVGMQRILALRDRARTAMGSRYDQRRFHDRVLGSGSVPLPVLEAQVERWVTAPA